MTNHEDPMTRQRLEEIIAACDCTIAVDRITTGNASGGFHTFEIVSDVWNLAAAHKRIAAEWTNNPAFVAVRYVDNPEHPNKGKPYLCVESFWC